jgi:protein kinase/serine/threonine-protein kinase
MFGLKRFIHEIHRRSVWQVVGIYLLGGWIALQVVDTLTGALQLPDWFPSFALVLLVIGFPIVLATSFVQEGIAGPGSPRTPPTEHAEGEPVDVLPWGTLGRLFTWRNAILGGMAAFSLWGVIAALWVLRMGVPTPAAERGQAGADIALRANAPLPAVAVLPFSDLSSERDFAFFADGVHEDILTNLSKLSGLLVLSRTSVMRYRDTQKPMPEIAAELGATAMIGGSVRRSGDRVRITAQLIDAQSDAHLWAETYDRDLSDVFAVQSEIAFAVAEALQAALGPGEVGRVSKPPTADLTAYDLYLEGRQAYARYEDLENERAIQLFKRAISRDSTFSGAWAGLANAYAQYVNRWAGALEWADSAMAAGERAVRLDPESSEAYKALGLARSQAGRLESAVAAYRRSLELNPNNSSAAHNLGVESSVLGTGRLDEAIRWYHLAGRLSPDPLTTGRLAEAYAYLGLHDRARRVVEQSGQIRGASPHSLWPLVLVAYAEGHADTVLALSSEYAAAEPRNAAFRARAAWTALWAGELELAESHARDAQRLAPNGVLSYKNPTTVLGSVALARGDTAAARQHLEASRRFLSLYIERERLRAFAQFQLGIIHVLLGRGDEALRSLEQAAPVIAVPWWLEREAAFDPLRGDPRFDDLLRRARDRTDKLRRLVIEDERRGRAEAS